MEGFLQFRVYSYLFNSPHLLVKELKGSDPFNFVYSFLFDSLHLLLKELKGFDPFNSLTPLILRSFGCVGRYVYSVLQGMLYG